MHRPVMDPSILRARAVAAARPASSDVETLAWLLDNSIPIPGTGRRIGLDAVIGLVPGLGDVLSGGLGLFVVLRGAQLGVPGIVLARMLANVAVDFAIGSIPLIGDAFDLWFKANARNVGLIRRYTTQPRTSTVGSWALFGVILLAVVVLVVGAVWLVARLLGTVVG